MNIRHLATRVTIEEEKMYFLRTNFCPHLSRVDVDQNTVLTI